MRSVNMLICPMTFNPNPQVSLDDGQDDPLAPTPVPDGAFDGVVDPSLSQQSPYEDFEILPIGQCVTHYDAPDAPVSYFAYGVVIGFDNPEDHSVYLNHPEQSEIEATIIDRIQEENEETLRLEIARDTDKESYPNAGHDSFNSGTIGDFSVSVDATIESINKDYGTNISGGFVPEQSAELPGAIFCETGEPVPDDVAATHTNTSIYKM